MSNFIVWFRELFTDQTYGKTLENYILSHNPTSIDQVETLERQWHMHNSRNRGDFLIG